MKKISTVLLLIAITAAGAVAQEYKAFRVGLGLGYANASGKGAKEYIPKPTPTKGRKLLLLK